MSNLPNKTTKLSEYDKKENKLLNSIHNEYCLKRNQFYPDQPSPNLFCNRLEIRMKAYYSSLYNNCKL